METNTLKDFSTYANSIEKYIFVDAFDELFKYTNISVRVLCGWLSSKSCNPYLFFNNEALCKHIINNSNDLNETDWLIVLACRCWNLNVLKELISSKKPLPEPKKIAYYASNVILHRRLNFNCYTGTGLVDDPIVFEILNYLFSLDNSSVCDIEYRELLSYVILRASDSIINMILDFMSTKRLFKEVLNSKYDNRTIESDLLDRKAVINVATLERFKELGCKFSFSKWYFNKFLNIIFW